MAKFILFWNFCDNNFWDYVRSQSFSQHKFLVQISRQIRKNKCFKNLCSQNLMLTLTGSHVILFSSKRLLIDSRPPNSECNMGTRPITKFLFKLIYNSNIFPAFRKVILSLRYSEIEALKALGLKFWKIHNATWSETVLLQISWTILKTRWWEVFAGFWEFI